MKKLCPIVLTKFLRAYFFVVIFGGLAGCGNYTSTTRAARDEFYAGKFSDAAEKLKAGAHEDGVDQLLYLFDRATSLHHAADYEQSNREFHLADKLAEIKDYTSLSSEAATLFSNDKILPYKGEDFEKVLISQYLSLNYFFLKKYEDALVECRRVNHKLHMMISQGKRKYKLNPMAHYLAALMYEDQREWSDAFVDYQNVFKLLPDFEYLREDLYRLAFRNRIYDPIHGTEYWSKHFSLSVAEQERIRKTADWPELVIIIEYGQAPEKVPHEMWQAIPRYRPRYNSNLPIEIRWDGKSVGQSRLLFNVEQTAIENLDEKFAAILAKRIGGVVAKEVVAHEVGKRTDPLFGAILRMGLHAVDQADLRSWLTLPKEFQIFRIRFSPDEVLKTNLHHLQVGSVQKTIMLSKNQKTLVSVRVF